MMLISLLSDTSRARRSAATLVLLVALLSLGLVPLDGADAATTVPLGTAEHFALLAGSTITNTGQTVVTGDIGLHPNESVTGFGPGADAVTQDGSLHLADAVALDAKNDLTTAYTNAAGQGPATQVPTELGQTTLTAGVYDSASGTFGVSGPLTLDGEGNPDAVFIFQMDSTLITASASSVNVANGADLCNVFWQVGSSATLGSDSTFLGTVMADQSITLNSGATIQGRLLAREGAVTMNRNVITNAACTTPTDTDNGTDEPDTDEPDTDNGTDEPDTDEPDTDEPDTDDGTDDGTSTDDDTPVDRGTPDDGDALGGGAGEDDSPEQSDTPTGTTGDGETPDDGDSPDDRDTPGDGGTPGDRDTPNDGDTTGQVREVPGGAVAAGGGPAAGPGGALPLLAVLLVLLLGAVSVSMVGQRPIRGQGA